MGACCGCDSKQDIVTEIKKVSAADGSAAVINSRCVSVENSKVEQILLKLKENPLKEYSLLLFQDLNKFRTEPHQYYAESLKYNLDDIVKELMNIKNKNIKKDLKLEWSTKKEIVISNIMNDESIKDIKTKMNIIKQKFESFFELIILFVQGDYNKIRDSLWEALTNFKKLDEKIFINTILNKIDYCVIYSIKDDDLIFKKLYTEEKDNYDIDINTDTIMERKDENNNENESLENGKENNENNNKIISFYFLFNYLDDDDKTNNIINSNVVNW